MFDSILNEPYYTMDNTFPLGICGREANLCSNEKIVQQLKRFHCHSTIIIITHASWQI